MLAIQDVTTLVTDNELISSGIKGVFGVSSQTLSERKAVNILRKCCVLGCESGSFFYLSDHRVVLQDGKIK